MNAGQQQATDIAVAIHNVLLLGAAGTGKSFVVKEIYKQLSQKGGNVKVTCSTGIACSVKPDHMATCTVHTFLGLSDGRENFLVSLKRPLPVYQANDSIKLFANNDLVDDFNRTSLLNYSGDLYQFKSTDCGEISGLRTIPAPEILWVKVGCPVILLHNSSDKLVNGLVGKIHSINVETGPVVEFATISETVSVQKAKFSVFNPALNKNIAEREQYPLKPAFGLTIHKAQGMSLNRVEIDCREIFRPGQLGVALSRATSTHGLRVINFHQRYVIKPPALISEFMRKESAEILQSLSCCQTQKCITGIDADDHGRSVSTLPGGNDHGRSISTGPGGDGQGKNITGPGREAHGSNISIAPGGDGQARYIPPEIHSAREERPPSVHEQVVEVEGDEEEDLEDDFSELIESINTAENEAHEIDIPEGFDIGTMRQGLNVEKEVTTSHKRLNEIINSIDETKLKFFTKTLLVKLGTFAKSLLNKESDQVSTTNSSIPEKHLSTFYSLVHNFNTSAEYRMHCWFLFDEYFSDEHMIICYRILEFVRIFYIKRKFDLLGISSGRYVTNSSYARVRYVAGYCVSKLRKTYVDAKKSKLFSTSEEGQNLYHEAKCKVNIINMLKEDEHYLNEHSQYPESLLDNQRRQQVSRSLINVSDSLYQFFLSLTESLLHLVIYENLLKFGKDLYIKCYEQVYKNKKLYQNVIDIVSNGYSSERIQKMDECTDESFYVGVPLDDIVLESSQILIVYTDRVNKFLRVLIAQFRKDVKLSCKLDRRMAHRKQIKVSTSGKMSTQTGTKPTLSQPSGALKRKTSSKGQTNLVEEKSGKGKHKHAKRLNLNQSKNDSEPKNAKGSSDQSCEQEPQPGPSNEQCDLLNDSEMCRKCNADKDDEFIQCVSCNGWWHRRCSGLQQHNKWLKYQRDNVQWFCKECT